MSLLTSPTIYTYKRAHAKSTLKSYSLGLRYNINPKTAFKIDASHFYDFDDTGGRFKISNDTNLLAPQKLHLLGESSTLLTFGIDSVF